MFIFDSFTIVSELEYRFKSYLECLIDCIDGIDPERLPFNEHICELERMFEDLPGKKIISNKHILVKQLPLLQAKFYISLNKEDRAAHAWKLWTESNDVLM